MSTSSFDELIAQCKECTKCILRKTAKQVVPGSGNAKAEIMFIGEGPGKNEDEQGVPFCGAAGKFLDELLDHIDLKRDDVYITNMVKCRPPGNRDPKEDEMLACKPWLDQQIEIMNPKVFVLLGRFAMGRYFPKLRISQEHGKAFKKDGKLYFIMYHPAVALYNGNYREILKKDFEGLRKVLAYSKSESFGKEVSIEEVIDIADDIKKKMEEGRERKKKSQIGMSL